MGCCGNSNGKYYSRACADKYCKKTCDKCCDTCDNYYDRVATTDCECSNDLTGISCPFHNNNDCGCADSLRDAACRLTNQRVIIHVDGCKMCVVIVGIGECFLKAINPCSQKIVYFNLNRIDNIEDVLPRCY